MFNSPGLITCGPPANYVSSNTFAQSKSWQMIALILAPPLPRLTCIVVWHVAI